VDYEDHPDGLKAEVVFSMHLVAPAGYRWGACDPARAAADGVRIISCSGEGGSTADIVVGSNPFATGVVPLDCDHRDDPFLEMTSVGLPGTQHTKAKITAHVKWCTNSAGQVRFVEAYRQTELYKNPNDSDVLSITFNENGDVAHGWTVSDGHGFFQVGAVVKLFGHGPFRECRMLIYGTYIGSSIDHSLDVNSCAKVL
jgi:hypothetical protein